MKLTAKITGSLKTQMDAEMRRIDRGVAAGVREAGEGLKGALRRQVIGSGLGTRLARSWRGRAYPNRGHDAAALVWTKAPQILRAFDEGATIRARGGRFLAIPTPAAPKRGLGGRRLTPATFPTARHGPLRFVDRRGRPALLVVDGVRLGARTGRVGRRAAGGGRTKSGGFRRGIVTVPMFVLVPRVRLGKRLDVARAAERAARSLPRRIVRKMEERPR